MSETVLRAVERDPNARPISVQLAGRLTCICPFNGRRDYATVEVCYTPAASLLELESFGHYLAQWSETQASHELVTDEIAADLYAAIEADDITVRTRWEPVEGIECVVVAHR